MIEKKEGSRSMNAAKNFEFNKTYYIDKTGMPIDEYEAKQLHTSCTPIVETCCNLRVPRGFEVKDAFPNLSFDLSKLSCIKNPIMEKVFINTHDYGKPLECEVVAGYEVRLVGGVNFSFSAPINPKQGFCFPHQSHTCCTSTVPVNMIISHTCCPRPCPSEKTCYDWRFAYFCVREINSRYGTSLQITMGLAFEYTDSCDNDDSE